MKLHTRIATAFLVVVIALVAVFTERGDKQAQAQDGATATEAAEYAQLISVASEESYGSEIASWKAPTPAHRETIKSRVFTYEINGNVHTDRAAYLSKLNQLAQDGWKLVDANTGLLERIR